MSQYPLWSLKPVSQYPLWRTTSWGGWTKPQCHNTHYGGLRPAVDGQSLSVTIPTMEDYVLQWMDKASVSQYPLWRTTSCSGWTKPQCHNTHYGGLHPEVDGQSLSVTIPTMEDYILRWMDKASVSQYPLWRTTS